VAPKKLKKEIVGNVESINTMQENVGIRKRLRSKGQTKDFRRGRRLSGLYSKNSSIKIKLI